MMKVRISSITNAILILVAKDLFSIVLVSFDSLCAYSHWSKWAASGRSYYYANKSLLNPTNPGPSY